VTNSFLLVPEPSENLTCLECEECGGLHWMIVWVNDFAGKKVEAACGSCLARCTLALPFDPRMDL
jgi:hypothetical protein